MISEHKDELNYWPSFVDIFASLFFIFLILFSLYYASERMTSEAVKRDLEDLKSLATENTEIVLDTLSVNFYIPSDIVFKLNDYELTPAGVRIANEMGRSFGKFMGELVTNDTGAYDGVHRYNKYSIIIEGHTDTSGSPYINDPLSLRRANSLISNMRDVISPSFRDSIAFIPVGYGESKPKYFSGIDNKKYQGNRRVEIKILPKFNETQLKVWKQILRDRNGTRTSESYEPN